MLRRAALVLLLLVFSGIAAIFAAGHFGLRLPWQIAAPTDTDPASKDREQAAPSATLDGSTAGKAETAIEEAAKALGGVGPGDAAPAPGSVALDVARISPDGLSVFAGRAEPNSYVTVLENGRPAGTVKSDEHGDWALATEHKFASAEPKLTFEVATTPPPEPAPAEVAEAPSSKPAAPAPPSAASVAGEVMRKFENLVAEAREEAAREAEKKAEEERKAATAATEPKAQPETKAAEAAPPAEPQAPGAPAAVAEAPKDDTPPVLPEVTAPAAPDPQTSASAGTPPGGTSAEPDRSRETTTAAAAPQAAPTKHASETGHDAPIPVPIMFVYNEATLTPEGKRAADLLLEYVTLKRLSAIELTGHADERGTQEYNFELSRERLDTVSDLLKRGGFGGELTLIPKGKTEPYMGVDRSKYHGEALFQLDRRVELRVTR